MLEAETSQRQPPAVLDNTNSPHDCDVFSRATRRADASHPQPFIAMLRIAHIHSLTLLLTCLLCGCGTTKSRSATEQLLISDAVDRAVAGVDFRPLAGRSVYLDTQYVKSVKGGGFINANYIISSLRQQMLAANCNLQEKAEDADYIAEVRVGALGTDGHRVTYGIPASSGLSNAASLVPNSPPIPTIPEISIAKREDEMAAAKIAVFAYHRETRKAVWQSGLAQARSTAKDIWLFGAGPFQNGAIHERPHFAGEELEIPFLAAGSKDDSLDRLKSYGRDISFIQPPNAVQPATHAENANGSQKPKGATEAPAPPVQKKDEQPPQAEKK